MPNRILRDSALESDRIAQVSEQAEVLFYRLLMLADDFGRFDGRAAVIRGRAFALRPQVTDGEIETRLSGLEQAGLINLYQVDGKPFLEIPRFGQRLRAEKSKFPNPPPQSADSCQTSDRHPSARARVIARGRGSEAESYTESYTESIVGARAPCKPRATPRSNLEGVLDPEHAGAVIEHRQRIRKPLTAHAAGLLAGKFARCADPNAAADAMIANGWQGFEPSWLDGRARQNGTGPPGLIQMANKLIEKHRGLENGHLRQDCEGTDEAESCDPPALPGPGEF